MREERMGMLRGEPEVPRWVGWEAGMRVSVYEGWRSELWGTWWCPGWQPRWHYLRVCHGRKAKENKREKEGKCERKKEKGGEGIRASTRKKRDGGRRPTKRNDRKRGGARERNESRLDGEREPLQKDTGGQRGIRPTGRATRDRTNKGNV